MSARSAHSLTHSLTDQTEQRSISYVYIDSDAFPLDRSYVLNFHFRLQPASYSIQSLYEAQLATSLLTSVLDTPLHEYQPRGTHPKGNRNTVQT